ncbi:MAG: type VII toxin-antitoxin system MntA family adenylyltransferase antitoxin [Candidatus Brocadiia bacterium]
MSERRIDIDALEDFLGNEPNVVLATLFGSSSNGFVSPGSDIDIAILYHDPPEPMEEFEYYYNCLCDVTEDIAPISLVNLNSAEPILAFEALRGRFICRNDLSGAAEFQSLTCRMYEDVMGNLERQRRLRRQDAEWGDRSDRSAERIDS